MCTVLHDKIQWKKKTKQRNKSWQNETKNTDQFQKQSKKQSNKTNKGREVFSFKIDVEGFRYLVKVSGHRSGNV